MYFAVEYPFKEDEKRPAYSCGTMSGQPLSRGLRRPKSGVDRGGACGADTPIYLK